MEEIKILVVDVGVQHLGLVLALVRSDYTLSQVVDFNLVDISTYTHHNPSTRTQCLDRHTRTFADWTCHVFLEHPCFGEADQILVERQPPGGFVVIEQLIFSRFRDKTILVHPRTVHSFLGITGRDYDGRKAYSEFFAAKYLSPEQREELGGLVRQHDIADAVCMLIYWINKHNYEHRQRQHLADVAERFKDNPTIAFMESCRYIARLKL